MTDKENVIQTMHFLKVIGISISIEDELENKIGWLVPIGCNYKTIMPYLPKLLGKWRKENPSLSASQFEITEENTTNWLDNLILSREDRVLFMINDVHDNHVGHIGYSSFNFNDMSAEIDCVLRGIKTNTPIMTHALRTLLQWGMRVFKLRDVYLSTMKDNTKSIALYERCGFKILYDIPLFKHTLPSGEIRWDEDKTKDPMLADRVAVYMKYIKEKE